ncbi:MAG TPA: hypothetical protein VEY92_02655 [Pseudoxanthomonas sp.]|nr:hypothetical protein [Pseudoxanthomonas sp.]
MRGLVPRAGDFALPVATALAWMSTAPAPAARQITTYAASRERIPVLKASLQIRRSNSTYMLGGRRMNRILTGILFNCQKFSSCQELSG